MSGDVQEGAWPLTLPAPCRIPTAIRIVACKDD